MTITQSNKLTMYEAVLETLNTHRYVWQDASVVAEAVRELEALLPQIRKAGATKATSLKGITTAKGTKKQDMAELATRLAALTTAYAAKTKNASLQAAVDFSLSDLVRAKDNIAIDRCTAIHDQVRVVLPQVEAYGITGTDLDTLQAAIASFQASIGALGQQQSSRSATVQSLSELFSQVDTLLKMQLDNLMLRYQLSDRAFYDTYVSSRITRKLGGSHKPVTPVSVA